MKSSNSSSSPFTSWPIPLGKVNSPDLDITHLCNRAEKVLGRAVFLGERLTSDELYLLGFRAAATSRMHFYKE